MRAGKQRRVFAAMLATFVLLLALAWVNWGIYDVGIGIHEGKHEMRRHIQTVGALQGYGTLAAGLLVDLCLIVLWAQFAVWYYARGKRDERAAAFD